MRGLGSLSLSRHRARIDANLSGAIYGTITAAAVIAASAAHDEPASTVFFATAATLVVFWLAHVYAEIVAHHFKGHRPSLDAVAAATVRELPVLVSPALSMLLLALGAIGLLDDDVAVNLALWAAVVQLTSWGVAYARQMQWSWPAAAVTGAINGMLGVTLIVLKALLH